MIHRSIAVLFTLTVAALCWAAPPPGYWVGAASIGESEWPIAVRFTGEDDGVAYVDVDDIGMFDTPLALQSASDEAWSIEMPFGLQTIGFTNESDQASAEYVLSPTITLTMTLDRVAEVPPYTRREVTFESDGAVLAGTIYTPRNAGSSTPGAVILHGSSLGSREVWELRRWVKPLLAEGVTVLVYDRRGQGESSVNDHGVEGFGVLAGDALAARRTLGEENAVDASRVGFVGGSQAAWVAADAAAHDPGVAFLILSGVPAVAPSQQERQSAEVRARRAGLSGPEIHRMLAYMDLYFYVATTGDGYDLLEAAVAEAQRSPWGEFVDQPQSLDDLDWWKTHASFDMQSRFESISVPLLSLWGENDVVCPPAPNRLLLEEASARAGNTALVTLVCPDATHSLEVPGMGFSDAGEWVWPRLSPVAREAVAEFLVQHVLHED